MNSKSFAILTPGLGGKRDKYSSLCLIEKLWIKNYIQKNIMYLGALYFNRENNMFYFTQDVW